MPNNSANIQVQSAPLTEARGDASIRTGKSPYAEFQSAPLTEARGDQAMISGWGCDTNWEVSIRSPHRSKGRQMIMEWVNQCDTTGDVSIRSPHRSKGRPLGGPPAHLARLPDSFQSAPLTEARGDPCWPGRLHRNAAQVSIRSPHRSKGRRGVVRKDVAAELDRFNPLPSPKQGETGLEASYT